MTASPRSPVQPRTPSAFKQRDVTAAIKAARKAGETGAIRVEIEPGGKLVIITHREADAIVAEPNEWDED